MAMSAANRAQVTMGGGEATAAIAVVGSGSASGGDDDGGGGGETTEAMGEESGRNRVSDYGIARTAVGDGEEAHVSDGGDTCG